MENKTISHLNSTGWYRLLKVIFIFVFLVALAIFNVLIISNGVRQVDQNLTTIKCNLGDKKSFSAKSIDLNLRDSDFTDDQFNYKNFFEGYNDYSLKEIMTACYPKRTSDAFDSQRQAELINKYGLVGSENSLTQEQKDIISPDYESYKKQVSGFIGNDKAKYLDFSFKMFDITPAFTYGSFLGYFFIGNIIILLIFEAIRRTFYYIVLGKLKPEK